MLHKLIENPNKYENIEMFFYELITNFNLSFQKFLDKYLCNNY